MLTETGEGYLSRLKREGNAPPECGNVKTRAELAETCSRLIKWWCDLPSFIKEELWRRTAYAGAATSSRPRARPFLEERIAELKHAAVRLGMTAKEMPDTDKLGETKALAVLNRLRQWAVENEAETKQPAGNLPVPNWSATNTEPRKLLTGWHEIVKALKMNYPDRKKIKSLNDRRGGPIRNQGKGTQPTCYSDELLEWWNTMDAEQQELANRREGRKLSAEAQYNYGRKGIAAPEIGGGVKNRRRDFQA